MSRYWSQEKKGFFDSVVHADCMPSDAQVITQDEYDRLILRQANGDQICTDASGKPDALSPQMVLMTANEVASRFSSRVQREVDSLASSWGYDSGVSASTYAASSVARFRNEAKAILAYRDAMWQWAGEHGDASPMTAAEFAERVEIMMADAPVKPDRPMGNA